MKSPRHGIVLAALIGLSLGPAAPARQTNAAPLEATAAEPSFSAFPTEHATSNQLHARAFEQSLAGPATPESSPCFCGMSWPASQTGLFAGAELLLVRAHWSEAVAFAQGTQSLTLETNVAGRELPFEREPSLRAFAGYRLRDGSGAIQFTYSRFLGDASAEGADPGPGGFLVDPFGNVVGTAIIIDPSDARFLSPAAPSGDHIRTEATVETNVFDVELIRPIASDNPNWGLHWSASVRIADVDQYYESVITAAGVPIMRGDFHVDFIGAGPRLGFESRRYCGAERRLSLFANGHGTLLLGEYDVSFSNRVGSLRAGQMESLTRTVPVFEAELGGSWRAGNSLTVAAGWLFHAWVDLGTSGGRFGGFFAGADDGNIMSFEGLFLKAEWLW